MYTTTEITAAVRRLAQLAVNGDPEGALALFEMLADGEVEIRGVSGGEFVYKVARLAGEVAA